MKKKSLKQFWTYITIVYWQKFQKFCFYQKNILTTNDFILQSTQTNLYQSKKSWEPEGLL